MNPGPQSSNRIPSPYEVVLETLCDTAGTRYTRGERVDAILKNLKAMGWLADAIPNRAAEWRGPAEEAPGFQYEMDANDERAAELGHKPGAPSVGRDTLDPRYGRTSPNRVHGHYYIGRVRVNIQDGPLETPCHVWQGTVDNQGYAKRIQNGRGHTNVHRDVYELEHGRIPPKVVVHHICEDKLCVNVDHLRTMTRADHIAVHRRIFDYDSAASLSRAGHTVREIAAELGVARSTIQMALQRMRKRGEL